MRPGPPRIYRFFAPQKIAVNESFRLSEHESRHLRDVIRLGAGIRVNVFDGFGGEWLCEVGSVTKRGATLRALERVPAAAPESSLSLTLAVALLKKDKFDLVVQKAVELGAVRLIPLIPARCDVKKGARAGRMPRWERIAVESSKQCGRAKLMAISEPLAFEDAVCGHNGTGIIFSERGGTGFPDIEKPREITALIGPEGGWEPSEIELAGTGGFHAVTLGGRVLRAETAAIAAATLLQHRFGDLI